jgi:hypothetical protein
MAHLCFVELLRIDEALIGQNKPVASKRSDDPVDLSILSVSRH